MRRRALLGGASRAVVERAIAPIPFRQIVLSGYHPTLTIPKALYEPVLAGGHPVGMLLACFDQGFAMMLGPGMYPEPEAANDRT